MLPDAAGLPWSNEKDLILAQGSQRVLLFTLRQSQGCTRGVLLPVRSAQSPVEFDQVGI